MENFIIYNCIKYQSDYFLKYFKGKYNDKEKMESIILEKTIKLDNA